MMTSRKEKKADVKKGARQPTALDAKIGAMIRERRLAQGLSQTELCSRLKITQRQLQKYETGENRISASRLIDCSRELDVPVSWFYGGITANNSDESLHLSAAEQDILDLHRALSPEQQRRLTNLMQDLKASGSEKKKPRQEKPQ